MNRRNFFKTLTAAPIAAIAWPSENAVAERRHGFEHCGKFDGPINHVMVTQDKIFVATGGNIYVSDIEPGGTGG